jgi:hypothetical protein
MKNFARTVFVVGALMGSALTLGACAYGGVAAVGTDRVIITRNDSALFGVLRKVYMCKVTETGLSECTETEAP